MSNVLLAFFTDKVIIKIFHSDIMSIRIFILIFFVTQLCMIAIKQQHSKNEQKLMATSGTGIKRQLAAPTVVQQ